MQIRWHHVSEGELFVKITILDITSEEEEEVIIKCHEMTEDMQNLIQKLKNGKQKLTGYSDSGIHLLEPNEVYYFESVDQKVFAYCESDVYEIKSRLYELENELSPNFFMRSSKSTILNLNKIRFLSPAFGGRFEAFLDNDEKTIISRQYVAILKERLGL